MQVFSTTPDGKIISSYNKVVIECDSPFLKKGFCIIDPEFLSDNRCMRTESLDRYIIKADAIVYLCKSSIMNGGFDIAEDINAAGRRDIVFAYTFFDMVKEDEADCERFIEFAREKALDYTDMDSGAIHFIDSRSALHVKISDGYGKVRELGIAGLKQTLIDIKKRNMGNEQFYNAVIGKCIERLDTLLKEYPNEKYRNRLSDIRKRYNNPELKLAVIGEFNTGKSTFINAILRKNFLSMHNVPTTVIPTYIRWDERLYSQPAIKVTLLNENREYEIKKDRNFLEKKLGIKLNHTNNLERIVTNNRLIGIVSHVTISFPKNKKFSNFCLIDTPGVNPGSEETKKHIDITRGVLRDEADATIVIFPADMAGNRSALEFVSENASHLMDGASFVITKSDIVDNDKEMDKISGYLMGLVRKRYGLDEQVIYCCSAKKALKAIDEERHSDKFLLDFDNMVDCILKELDNKRKQIIFKKVLSLINDMLCNLKKEQLLFSEKLDDDMNALETYSLEKLEKEYKKLYTEFEADLQRECTKKCNLVNVSVTSEICETNRKIRLELDGIKNISGLRNYAGEGIKKRLDSFENIITGEIKKDICVIEGIYSDFSEKVFFRLKEYQLQVSSQIEKSDSGMTISPNVSVDRIIGGLGIGTLILLFVNPVTLAAVLAVGWLFSDTLTGKMKNIIREKVESGLGKVKSSVEEKWKSTLNETKLQYLLSGKNLMSDYKEKYREIFEARISNDLKERERIKSELNKVNIRLKETDIMESALELLSRPNFCIGMDRKLTLAAINGDSSAVKTIAEQYLKLYEASDDKKYYELYLQWSACSLLLGDDNAYSL